MKDLIEAIQKVVRQEIKQEIGDKFDILNSKMTEHDKKLDSLNNKILEHDKKLDSINNKLIEHDKKFDSINNKLIEHDNALNELNNRTSKIESDIKDFRESLFILEHEHSKKIDAIYDLVYLDKEINKPKLDEISKISKKSDLNQLHILNHEDRICTLEKHNS